MTRARNIANRALSDITSPNTDQDITITPNGTGNVVVETDTFTIRNTDDGVLGPTLVLDHTTTSPSTSDTNALFSTLTTDAGGTEFTPVEISYQTPDVTSGAATGKLTLRVKEDSPANPLIYVILDGDAEQVTVYKPIVTNATSKIEANGGLEVNGKLDIEEVVEKIFVYGQGGGTFFYDTRAQAIAYDTTAQFQNRTLSLYNVNTEMTNGQTKTVTWILTMGATAYYPTIINVDGVNFTSLIKWQGGSAPTSGNANGLDVYTFTIIKTADATFTVLGSQTQFA
jgi:hypothetical protein